MPITQVNESDVQHGSVRIVHMANKARGCDRWSIQWEGPDNENPLVTELGHRFVFEQAKEILGEGCELRKSAGTLVLKIAHDLHRAQSEEWKNFCGMITDNFRMAHHL